MKKKVWLCI